ncbi:hypothetical protein Y032_0101g3362 [Ancylostoma ceylanicum]|nr:hypothetical protein Y032_0101g3362 [Ancylostoma ceylanicum]
MVWEATTKVGCAIAVCGPNTFTVCRYSPRESFKKSRNNEPLHLHVTSTSEMRQLAEKKNSSRKNVTGK